MTATPSLFSVADRVIVVTGASGVLAGSAALHLQRQGARVVLLGQTPDKVAAAEGRGREVSQEVMSFACDVLDREALADVRGQVLDRWGRIDGLVNGAGGNRPGATVGPDASFFDLDLDDYAGVLDLNLKGTLVPTLVFGEAMAERGVGSVVNISSMAATLPVSRVLGYSNAKAGVESFTRWLAAELGNKVGAGVRVNAISPGFFVADQNRALLQNDDGSPTTRGQSILAHTPFGRFGVAEDLHGCFQFLLSPASGFLTGFVITVDGGFSATWGI